MAENYILPIPGNSVSLGLKPGVFLGKYLVNSGFLIPSSLTFPLGVISAVAIVARRQPVWPESHPPTRLGTSVIDSLERSSHYCWPDPHPVLAQLLETQPHPPSSPQPGLPAQSLTSQCSCFLDKCASSHVSALLGFALQHLGTLESSTSRGHLSIRRP